MGTYLSKPITEKISSDGKINNISYGSSSMQGWRIYQEDAHNTLLDFDEDRYLFAVYDGHGGHEVAAYTATNFPNFIKLSENYKKGNYCEAMTEAFLNFDSTLIEPKVLQTLKEIAGTKDEDDSDYDGEEVSHLCREATMPLEEVMAKYSEPLSELYANSLKLKEQRVDESSANNNESGSSTLKADPESLPNSIYPDSESPGCSSAKVESSTVCSLVCLDSSPSEKDESTVRDNESVDGVMATGLDLASAESTSVNINHSEINDVESHSQLNGKVKEGENNSSVSDLKLNHHGSESLADLEEISSSKNSASVIIGEKLATEAVPDSEDKGKNPFRRKNFVNNSKLEAVKTDKRLIQKRKAVERAKTILIQLQTTDPESDEGSSDDEDNEDEDDSGCEGVHDPLRCNNADDSDFESDEDESEESEENSESEYENAEEEEEPDEDEKNYNEFAMNMREEPGFDSGCTACVVLIQKTEVIVANVGDSRCVVCRNGKAVDMSIDHKPEDDEESARIIKAGGKITSDGRVNGGLNLSRALGDHSYKQNKNLKPDEQMISPQPDIRTLTLTPEDQFMIIACDGIWNSMSSQEACDYVTSRLKADVRLSSISEEMFEHCLAPDVHGDGTGCDNMTCIIVRFHGAPISAGEGENKRDLSDVADESDEPAEKRAKLELLSSD